MSNVYTKLSFSFDLGKDANDYLFKLANEIDSLVNNSDPDTAKASEEACDLANAYEAYDLGGFGANVVKHNNSEGLWIVGDEYPHVDLIAAAIHETLKKYNLEQVVAFEWSHDASRPVHDAYGGGAAVISKDEIFIQTTRDILEEAMDRMTNDNGLSSPLP